VHLGPPRRCHAVELRTRAPARITRIPGLLAP